MLVLGIGLGLPDFPITAGSGAPAVNYVYNRPDGTSLYNRPDGVSLYYRP